MFRALCAVFAMYGIPLAILLTISERAETMGYTDLSPVTSWSHPGYNYGVFRRSRTIHMITGLAPARILEMDGQITRIHTVMYRTLPVRFYRRATSAEKALWFQHFGT